MSASEASPQLEDLTRALHDRIASIIDNGQVARIAPREVTALLTEAVRVYAGVTEEIEREISPIDSSISTTEAMVVACALLRAHRLNPFDLALWFSRTRQRFGEEMGENSEV
jgi:hypothetical protein